MALAEKKPAADRPVIASRLIVDGLSLADLRPICLRVADVAANV